MDTAVALVQAYPRMNGYFTVAEYPVLDATAHAPGGSTAAGPDPELGAELGTAKRSRRRSGRACHPHRSYRDTGKTRRSLAGTHSTKRRLVFMLGIATALIAGLLAMHTLAAGHTHVESATTTSSAADHDQATTGPAVTSAVVGAAHCWGDCGAPGNLPHHSILVVCILALLAAVMIVLVPALLGRLSAPLEVVPLVADVRRALPRPRPPSLLVLSISRI